MTRCAGEPFSIAIGGAVQNHQHEGPRYAAMYEIDSPDVLTSPEWAKAVDLGRWPNEVRPFCGNRRYASMRVR